MKKTSALFLLILFATIALPIRGAASFNDNIVEEEIIAKKKQIISGYETFHFGDEFLVAVSGAKIHYHYAVTISAAPFLSVPGQPPNDRV